MAKRIETFRETIGGIEVVDAAYADELLNAIVKVMECHAQWRVSIDAFWTEGSNTNKNRRNSARRKYRKARKACWDIVERSQIPAPG